MRYKEGIKLDNFLLYPFSCSLSALQTPGGCRPGGISEWRVCARIWTRMLKHTPAQAHIVDYACMVDDTWSLCSVHNILPPFVSVVTVLSSFLFFWHDACAAYRDTGGRYTSKVLINLWNNGFLISDRSRHKQASHFLPATIDFSEITTVLSTVAI